MFTVDDFIKIMISISISFAIVGISFQIMRILGKFSSILEEVKTPVKDLAEVSHLVLSDYKNIRSFVGNLGNLFIDARSLFKNVPFLRWFKKESETKSETSSQ